LGNRLRTVLRNVSLSNLNLLNYNKNVLMANKQHVRHFGQKIKEE